MIEKSPEELRAFAKEVAQNTRKPFDEILLRKTKEITVEYKSGFLNLTTKTKKETKIETEKHPVNCWILEKYTEEDVEHDQYYDIYSFYYVLKSNGDLNVIKVRSEERHFIGNIYYDKSSAEINDMSFLTPGNFTIPIVRVNLSDLLFNKSAYQLDVAHCNWKRDKGNGDYIVRDFPYTLLSEGADDGAGEYQYSRGEGLYFRLNGLLDK